MECGLYDGEKEETNCGPICFYGVTLRAQHIGLFLMVRAMLPPAPLLLSFISLMDIVVITSVAEA